MEIKGEEKLKNCYFDKCILKACWMLDHRLNPEANVGNGLVQVNVQSIEDMIKNKPSICIGVLFRRNSKDKGLMLNFCPFCGANLKGWELKEYLDRKQNLEVKA